MIATASLFALLAAEQRLTVDLLIAGGDEAAASAAVQAARLGVKRIALVSDIEWLGGQFAVQGIGPVDEWTIVEGKRTSFPRSGAFLEIIQRMRAHNQRVHGVANPGNGWCGTETIEPKAAAAIFEEWLAPYTSKGSGQVTIYRGWEPGSVFTQGRRVTGVRFVNAKGEALRIDAALTLDSTDWGDVIRLSGARYLAGPDLRGRFGEPSAPESFEPGGQLEMNPISWCPALREAGRDATIPRPPRYDSRSFASMAKVPPFVDWDGSGGIYNRAGWSVYTHRRLVDRRHLNLAAGTEMTVLNWPAQDYPLYPLPQQVADALERTEPGASRKNIVQLTPAQRRIIFADAKSRALEFLYYLQTEAHQRVGDYPESFRYMKLIDDYGTADRLPPKPYIREGLRLEALYMLREQDVRTPAEDPLWAKALPPDALFGYQFNIDFHPTRRRFADGDSRAPWQPEHVGTRNWSTHTDRAVFPLRSLVPVEFDGLLGCSKNIGVTSMVQSSLRLHGQMMHVGQAAATVAWLALRDGVQPREVAASPRRWRQVQRRMVEGAGGPGTLLWPWHDLPPEAPHFNAANMLAVAGIWRYDADSLFFDARRPVTNRELTATLERLWRAINAPQAKAPPPLELATGNATWQMLYDGLQALSLPASPTLVATPRERAHVLTRAECVDFLYRVLRQRGEWMPEGNEWLVPGGDHDGDGVDNLNDPLPFDRDNNNLPDRLQASGR